LPAALQKFEEYNTLENELHEAYPQNVDFKNALAISYEKLGSTHTALGNLPAALQHFEEYNRLEKELHEAYPQNVDFKNVLAISYSQLACYYRDKMNDPAKAQLYFQQCHDIWKALSNQFPDYQEFKINFEWAKNAISKLVRAADPVYQRIQNEPDTLAQYQLYTELCDTLRRRAVQDPAQKIALADALNSRAWTGFFLKKFAAVEADVREGLALGTDNKFLPTNLAPALLLQGKQKEAVQEYKKWKDKPFGGQDYPTYREAFLDDLNTFEKAGIIPPEVLPGVQEVRKWLGE
jgi:tetratricopeptide (TPR) repeat protein